MNITVSEGLLGQALAFAPVYINDQGPFHFAIDTGASMSVVDQSVADRLGLPAANAPGQAAQLSPGAAGSGSVQQVEVARWRLGAVELSPGTSIALDLPDRQTQPGLGQLLGEGQSAIDGLLGSDLLGGFGVITLNYDQELLVPGATP